jgi:long-subunit fatty acid transport protein
VTAGVNYFPTKDIVIKAQYSAGMMKDPFMNENSLSIGVAYAGFFTR